MNAFTRALIFIVCTIAFSLTARAGCDITGFQSVVPSTLDVGTYSATSIPPPTSISLTLTLTKTGNGNGNCQGEFALYRAAPPAQMTRQPPANVALPYTVTYQGSTILYFAGGNPTIVRLPNFHASSGNTTASVAITLTITPQTPLAAPPTGTYLDQLFVRVYNRNGNNSDFVGQLPIVVSATAIHSCYLSAPSSVSLNFTSDVATGIPAGAPKATSFNVNCTGPSRVQLSGSALVRPQAGPASGVFDSMINYRAVVNFGGASATLTTNGTSPVTVSSPSASTLVGSNLPVNLNVNLIPNRPLLGNSSYTGVLRVTVDPTL